MDQAELLANIELQSDGIPEFIKHHTGMIDLILLIATRFKEEFGEDVDLALELMEEMTVDGDGILFVIVKAPEDVDVDVYEARLDRLVDWWIAIPETDAKLRLAFTIQY